MSINYIKCELIGKVIQKNSDDLANHFADHFDSIIKDIPEDPALQNMVFNSLLSAFCAKLVYVRIGGQSMGDVLHYYESFVESVLNYLVEIEKNDIDKQKGEDENDESSTDTNSTL